jgi:hypothetical protein
MCGWTTGNIERHEKLTIDNMSRWLIILHLHTVSIPTKIMVETRILEDENQSFGKLAVST